MSRRRHQVSSTSLPLIVGVGRLIIVICFIIQDIGLVYYLVDHFKDPKWWSFLVVFAPAIIAYTVACYMKKKGYSFSWIVWLSYSAALIPMVVIIFDTFAKDLPTTNFWGPNALKSILSITPFIFLLLLYTVNSEYVSKSLELLAVSVTLDCFDSIELLENLLNKSLTLGRELEITILAAACVNILFPALALFELRQEEKGRKRLKKKIKVARAFTQFALFNLVYLFLRSFMWYQYGQDAAIFIAKNIIMAVNASFELCEVCRCCGCQAMRSRRVVPASEVGVEIYAPAKPESVNRQNAPLPF